MKNKSKITLTVTFVVLLILGIVIASLTSCYPTGEIYKVTKNEQYQKIDYGTISKIEYSSYTTESNCRGIVTLYCIQYPRDNHPQILKICGYYDHIQIGNKVWVYKTLPTNYYDNNRYIVIKGYKYPMLE
jgi:hypothetical protein